MIVDEPAVPLEGVLGALIPGDGVRELDPGCVSPERSPEDVPAFLSQDDEHVVATRQALPHERQRPGSELVRGRVDERFVPAAATVGAIGEEVAYGIGGQLALGGEPEHRGHGHELGEIRFAVRRGQNRARRRPVRRRGELPGQVEAALAVQIDVDDRHVGLELPDA